MRKVLFVIPLLLILFAFRLPAQSRILTNAQSGVYRSPRQLWFSVPDGDRLRVLVDGLEAYRGPSTASIQLGTERSGERSFLVEVERRSAPPDERILETRRFDLSFDYVAPPEPEPTLERAADGTMRIAVRPESGVRVRYLLDTGTTLPIEGELGTGLTLPSSGFAVLLWAEDAAGNYSAPRSFVQSARALEILSPAPGRWRNRQRLVLRADAGAEIRYTTDGRDPESAGEVYTAPVLLNATGRIRLRCVARHPDGRLERRDLECIVEGGDETAYSSLRALEETIVLEPYSVKLDEGWSWDILSDPAAAAPDRLRFQGQALTLRPLPGLDRSVACVIRDAQGLTRWIFTLSDGRPKTAPRFSSSSAALGQGPDAPMLYRSGQGRLIVWPTRPDEIRYRFPPETAWRSAAAPVVLSPEQERIEWIEGSASGSVSASPLPSVSREEPLFHIDGSLPAASRSREGIRIQSGLTVPCVVAIQDREGRYLSFAPWSLAQDSSETVDVCDGEELTYSLWRGRAPVVSWTVDRRPPEEPLVEAPADGSWLRGGGTVLARGTEPVVGELVWTDIEGTERRRPLAATARLEQDPLGPVWYTVSFWSRDEAGNESARVTRSYLVEHESVYARAPSPLENTRAADGSRDAPFSSVAEAVAHLEGREGCTIHLTGNFNIDAPVRLPSGTVLNGLAGPDWARGSPKASLQFEKEGVLLTDGGLYAVVSCELGSTLDAPLFSLQAGSRLVLRDCEVSLAAGLAELDAATITLLDSRMRAGSLGRDSLILLDGRLSEVRMRGCTVDVTAHRYASILDARGGTLSLQNCVLAAHAEDSVLLLLDDVDAELRDCTLSLDGAGIARAIDARVRSPSIRDSRLLYSGSSRYAVALSGAEPRSGGIGGSTFSGWDFLYARKLPLEDAFIFERRYAEPDRPNTYIDREVAP